MGKTRVRGEGESQQAPGGTLCFVDGGSNSGSSGLLWEVMLGRRQLRSKGASVKEGKQGSGELSLQWLRCCRDVM